MHVIQFDELFQNLIDLIAGYKTLAEDSPSLMLEVDGFETRLFKLTDALSVATADADPDDPDAAEWGSLEHLIRLRAVRAAFDELLRFHQDLARFGDRLHG